MAELLGADVHQKVFAVWIFAIEALDRVLHRRRELAIGTAELLKQHIAELWIRLIDTDGVHKLFDVMIHGGLWELSDKDVHQFRGARYVPNLRPVALRPWMASFPLGG
jgi:hypothetical protein